MKSIQELLEFSILIIDKPSGPTSAHVSEFVRSLLGIKRAGHCGTLDPAVSGVLPITLNRACKISQYFAGKDKLYVGIMRIHKEITDRALQKEMKQFNGTIAQMPPVRSAVKRALRTRNVKSFDMLEREKQDIVFSADVQAGTYIRTLINDLGKKIGGAHMLELRRTRAGAFNESQCITLYQLEEAVRTWKQGDDKLLKKILIPAEEALKENMQVVSLKPNVLEAALRGKPLYELDFIDKMEFKRDTMLAVFCGDRFIEVARVVNRGNVVAVPDFVYN